MSDPELQGVAAVGFTLVGSLANVPCAIALHRTSRHLHTPARGLALRGSSVRLRRISLDAPLTRQ